jgi:hypothetical protein
MIDPADERRLVIQDPPNFLEASLALIRSAAAIEVSPKLALELIVPKLGNSNPIPIIACGCIG